MGVIEEQVLRQSVSSLLVDCWLTVGWQMSNSWLTNGQHTYMYKRLTVSQNVQMVNSRTVGGLWENCWLRVYRQMADRFWGVAVFQFYQGRFNTLLVMGNFHGLGIHRYSKHCKNVLHWVEILSELYYFNFRSVETYLLDKTGSGFQVDRFFESVGVFIGVFSGSFFLGFAMGLVTALVSFLT